MSVCVCVCVCVCVSGHTRVHSFLAPLKLGGFLVFEIWTKKEVMKNCSEIGG